MYNRSHKLNYSTQTRRKPFQKVHYYKIDTAYLVTPRL